MPFVGDYGPDLWWWLPYGALAALSLFIYFGLMGYLG